MVFINQHIDIALIIIFISTVAVAFYKINVHQKVIFQSDGTINLAKVADVLETAHRLELKTSDLANNLQLNHNDFVNKIENNRKEYAVMVEKRLSDAESNCDRIGELERIVFDIRKRQENNASVNLTVPNHTYICGEASSKMQLFIVDKLDSLKEKLLEDIKKIHNGE